MRGSDPLVYRYAIHPHLFSSPVHSRSLIIFLSSRVTTPSREGWRGREEGKGREGGQGTTHRNRSRPVGIESGEMEEQEREDT